MLKIIKKNKKYQIVCDMLGVLAVCKNKLEARNTLSILNKAAF